MGVARNDPFFVQIRTRKKQFLSGFINFFITAELQRTLLILIESPNIFHWKSAKKRKVGVVLGKTFGPN